MEEWKRVCQDSPYLGARQILPTVSISKPPPARRGKLSCLPAEAVDFGPTKSRHQSAASCFFPLPSVGVPRDARAPAPPRIPASAYRTYAAATCAGIDGYAESKCRTDRADRRSIRLKTRCFPTKPRKLLMETARAPPSAQQELFTNSGTRGRPLRRNSRAAFALSRYSPERGNFTASVKAGNGRKMPPWPRKKPADDGASDQTNGDTPRCVPAAWGTAPPRIPEMRKAQLGRAVRRGEERRKGRRSRAIRGA